MTLSEVSSTKMKRCVPKYRRNDCNRFDKRQNKKQNSCVKPIISLAVEGRDEEEKKNNEQ